jgi:hypothetical protein
MDVDVLEHLLWAKTSLSRADPSERPGVYIVRETVTRMQDEERVIEDQQLLVRTDKGYKTLFEMAGYELLLQSEFQNYGTNDKYDRMRMYAIRPKQRV